MRELHRGGDSEGGEAADVLGGEELRVLDPRAQPERLPELARRLERVERLAVGAVADRVHCDGEAGIRCGAHDRGELVTARDPHPRAVEHPRCLRAERPIHEHLQVADSKQAAAEPGADAERAQLVHVLRGERLPDPQGQRAPCLERLPQP